MKIVCLVGDYAPLLYFAQRIHERFPVSLVVVERGGARRETGASRARRLYWKWRKHGTRRVLADLIGRPAARKRRSRLYPPGYRDDYERIFGDRYPALAPDTPRLVVRSINDPEVHERLSEIGPDVLLDHGTDLVKNHVIETAPLALNLHWGLSPYYRGSDCTEWALLNHDPYNVGVTVHKLARSIDGGEVLGQARPQIEPGDTVHSINMKLTRLGTDIILDALAELAAGRELAFHRQDRALGLLYRSEYMTLAQRKLLNRSLAEGRLARMLERPARKKRLPIVEFTPSTEAQPCCAGR